jgi:polysaccharide biosynthesis protein PslH
MRVLFLATRFPVPPWRGDQIRAHYQLKHLATQHEITLAVLTDDAPPPAMRAVVEAWGVKVRVVSLGRIGALGALGRVLAGDRRPFQTLWYLRARARRELAALLRTERFDLVHAQLVRTAAYLPDRPRPPVVVDFIDAMSANMARRAAHSSGPVAWVAALEAGRLRRFERALLERIAVGLVVAREDADLIAPDRIRVVPNGVDGALFRFDPTERARPRVIFGGNLGYFPNVDAAIWLAREIFPLIRAAVPAAELRLVGARPTRAVRALAALPGVSVAADVPSMADELAAARVALLPMRAGTGLQNKVLEALAVGTPVVTTARATAAFAVIPGHHLLVEERAADLARATAGLLAPSAQAVALARAGRRLVEERYLWESAAAALGAVWIEAAARTTD